MIFGLLVTAILVTLTVGVICYALKMKNSYLVLMLQFLISFAASYGVAYWMGKGVFTEGYIAAVCAVISLVIFALLLFLRKTIGPLDSREPGPLGAKLTRDQSRHHHGHT
ncbi:MAG: hypothetical protein H7318_19350 [Oligoflexus sp.]|nr:hypothetical protein [Oligoflexus sp.]